ncbi:MAG: CoA transferase [Deltaproteobacteria bacterium]|nr:CoA transferase [Deltaproteobacteria bacterium]
MTQGEPQHLLSGYTVLDFTQVLAGPTVTRLMAEMGAEVIKVELAPNGEISRALPFLKDGRSGYFIQQNRGKKSLCIDARHPKGQEILKELVKKVDVLVENFSPGAIARLGFGYDVVKELNPRIVMCSISALGQTGPLASVPGYDYIGQAYAGVTYMIGDPNGSPSFPMLGLGDVSTGVHAYAAIATALLYRERTGKGQYLDISLLDSYFHCHELNVQLYSGTGGAVQPKRSGSHHYAICPAGLFKGKNSYLFILCLEHQWVVLCRAIGRPELAADPRFSTNVKRVEHLADVIQTIEGWIVAQESDEKALQILQDGRVPAAPVLSIAEAVNHPHLRERRTVRRITDRVLGELDIPGMPLRFSEFPEELPLQAPFLGEHNEEVLCTHLSFTPEQIGQLASEGVLKHDLTK